MSVLATIQNLKIPYATEGVIRTAQLDDTVAPENSVQLAVNMNFDRVGAIQTRLGTTTYATSLAEEITNFGTLRNSVIPDGFDSIAAIGTKQQFYEFGTDYLSSVEVDDTHVLVFWRGVDGDGFAQIIETSLETGGATPLGSPLEFDVAEGSYSDCIRVTSTRYLNVWRGSAADGFAQVFAVNTSTWAVTAVGSPLEFDTSNGDSITVAQVDSSHFICFYKGASSEGIATIFAVDLGTFAVTEPGSPLTFDTTGSLEANSCAAVGDGIHFINCWYNGDGVAQVFTVNTGTWAITDEGTAFEFASGAAIHTECVALGDGEHFVVFYGTLSGGEVQVLEVDTGTWAVTSASSPLIFDADGANAYISAVSMGDSEHIVATWDSSGNEMFAQIFNIDSSTFAITEVANELHFGDTGAGTEVVSAIAMNSARVMVVWRDEEDFGAGIMLELTGDIEFGRWLYAGHSDEVSNWPDGGPWTVRRSGLAQVSKPRFAQFLNYIWMVNGNETIGGDDVATSDGTAFGTDLVPEDFPKGDFISAGFEGRVWVADSALGVIHYTDIVQFTPPASFTLTYNPEVNFITTIAPQSGEVFTALCEVPRALLVFTENTITRIYGASSIDAYPAYNVGTFSQESIVETKTGIFFHHSSGFYQFDYGSQPVEISRRIIDFVQAIPRSYYADVTGVYDGFDAVEWSVGQVTVEGVVYANCVLRYTISTQVWTVYDYPSNVITAMIYYDDGDAINHIMGTSAGLVGAMETGTTDFGNAFYFEFIDRWRSFTDMYYQQKSISGLNIYTENAAGANVSYQIQKSGPNAWQPLFTITEANNSISPNTDTADFDVLRLRVAGNTKGTQVVIHGMEIAELTIKGQNEN